MSRPDLTALVHPFQMQLLQICSLRHMRNEYYPSCSVYPGRTQAEDGNTCHTADLAEFKHGQELAIHDRSCQYCPAVLAAPRHHNPHRPL